MILAAITTCRRAPAMVERAVKSVIAQTYKDWDLVVVDDSPGDYEFRDDVRKMIEGYAAQDSRIHYVAHDKNYGVSKARNTALNFALAENTDGGHEFISYLDDDENGCLKSWRNKLHVSRNVMKTLLLFIAATMTLMKMVMY